MNNQLMALIEQHQSQMERLQTAQVDSESVFATVLAEFAIGESEQSLSAVLDSIEQIIEFAESQRMDLGGESAFALLRTLINAYYAGQDIDLQDRALSLLGRLLFRLSRKEIDRPTAEEIIRVVGLAQRGVSEESRNFQRFLQILLAVIDLLTADAALINRKDDLVRSLNRILRENRNRQIVSDSLSALVLLCDYLTKGEREGLLQSMTEAINTDGLEVFRRCLQVIVRFSGQRGDSDEKPVIPEERALTDEAATEAIALVDEHAITAVPDQIAQAIIDRLPRPEFSSEIVQRLDVLFVLIAPANSPQRAALMEMIARIVESDNYSQIETVLEAFRPLYPQLSTNEQVALSTGVSGLFNRGDLRYLDLAISVLDVFVADLSADDQTPIVRGLIRSTQSDEAPRIHAVLDLLPASYGGFHPDRRHQLLDELTRLMRTGTLEMVERSLACATAVRAKTVGGWPAEIEAELSQAIAHAIKTVMHETSGFPLAEYLIEFVVSDDTLHLLLPECLKTLERFRRAPGRENRVFELLCRTSEGLRAQATLYPSLPQAATLLGSFAQTHLAPLLDEFEQLLATSDEPVNRAIQSLTKTMLTTLSELSATVRVVNFILQNHALTIPSLIDAAAAALCSHDLHEGEADTFGLILQLYDVSNADAPARESITVGLRDAATRASTFQELERVTAVAVAAPDLPHFRKEELEREVLSRLVPLLRSADHWQQTTDLLHRLCVQMTHAGGVALRAQLMELLSEVDLPFATYQAIADLTFAHEFLQVDLPAVCAEKLAQFARIPDMSEPTFNLIAESWEVAPEAFKIRLTSEMQSVVGAEGFTYTPERYALLLRFIDYVYHVTDHLPADRESIQLHYLKALIRLSHTPELEESLYTLVRRETGPLHNILLPKPRVALSVWWLLVPLADHLPSYSKLRASVSGWKLPPVLQQSITLRQISIVFEHLLTPEGAPNQCALMRRAFVNALGQLYLADSDDEAVVEMGESLLSEFKAYIAGISDAEHHDWERVCRQIWQEDSRRGTPDVDRLPGRVRKELRRQIKEIFSS
ncbi:MAG: hypothetical protein O7E52_19060 [Candidatus Poribacteria bacterium]|nr:hypothetical protein [Candidatus Poribacteria bacterium]